MDVSSAVREGDEEAASNDEEHAEEVRLLV